jgi:hypothetical protein
MFAETFRDDGAFRAPANRLQHASADGARNRPQAVRDTQ